MSIRRRRSEAVYHGPITVVSRGFQVLYERHLVLLVELQLRLQHGRVLRGPLQPDNHQRHLHQARGAKFSRSWMPKQGPSLRLGRA
jgi:hypothetical protein